MQIIEGRKEAQELHPGDVVNIPPEVKHWHGSARKFAEEMMSSGTVDAIRKEPWNLKCEYFYPVEDTETVLLIDSWENQEAIDAHHGTEMMGKIFELREKYDLHMKVERFISDDVPQNDKQYIKE